MATFSIFVMTFCRPFYTYSTMYIVGHLIAALNCLTAVFSKMTFIYDFNLVTRFRIVTKMYVQSNLYKTLD